MQMRKQLRAGQALRVADLAKPDLVQRDDNVTLIYESTGLYLTIRGKALESGTEGDTVNVLNLQSQAHGVRRRDRPRAGRDLGRNAAPSRRRRTSPPHVGSAETSAPVSVAASNQFADRSKSRVKFNVHFQYPSYRAHRHLLSIASIAGGCSSIDRLSQIGEQPKLSAIENPTTQPGYKPVQMPMPKPEAVSYNANSLWRNGSRSFFKDQRAHQIGDLLTVTVNITDQANFANETQRSRTDYRRLRHHRFPRRNLLDRKAATALPGRLLTADSATSTDGKGSVQRQESAAAPTSPPSSPSCCRTAISWSKASRRSASISKCAN